MTEQCSYEDATHHHVLSTSFECQIHLGHVAWSQGIHMLNTIGLKARRKRQENSLDARGIKDLKHVEQFLGDRSRIQTKQALTPHQSYEQITFHL